MKITEIIYHPRKKVYTLLVEEKDPLTLYEDALVHFELAKGKEIDPELWENLIRVNTVAQGVQYACVYLLNTLRSQKNIQDKLKGKGYTPEAVEGIIKRLNDMGYIDDKRFALAYIESSLQRKSPRSIKQKLLEKGVSAELAQTCLDQLDAQSFVQDQIQLLGKKKLKMIEQLEPREKKEKLLRHLLYKGYRYEDCKKGVGKLLNEKDWEEV